MVQTTRTCLDGRSWSSAADLLQCDQCDPEDSLVREVFERICKAGIELGLSTSEQRLESTLMASNIRVKGRLGVVREPFGIFFRGFSDSEGNKSPEAVRRWFDGLDDQGWRQERTAKEAPQRLREFGQWITQTLMVFADAPNDRLGTLPPPSAPGRR